MSGSAIGGVQLLGIEGGGGLIALGQGDVAGQADSSLHYWEGYLKTTWGIPNIDANSLPLAYRRLGELYEQRGNREQALDYYGRFVDLWKGADFELQSVVTEVKNRMARLAGERE